MNRSAEYLIGLVGELRALPKETGWVEFKENQTDKKEIGEYLSALSNSATLADEGFAYLVWGVRNSDHKVVGTRFLPGEAKVGNEELENWLLRMLSPTINFEFHEVIVSEERVVVLEIERATHRPVQFRGEKFIRVGSYKKKLKDFPEKEQELWRSFDRRPFETLMAAERVGDGEVLRLLDYPAYFTLLNQPLPETRTGILDALTNDHLIHPSSAGGWNISNLGAGLFARRLTDFGPLGRRAVRVVQYRGNNRVETLKEEVFAKGYASDFEALIGYTNGRLPSDEVIGPALRRAVPMFPELAVRELVANALIHQDFFTAGTGPTIEIFEDRIEITNPGASLVDVLRLVDLPPRSRNEKLASLMRRMGICEELGTGWDKVVFQTELYQLPAPLVEVTEGHTRVVLFAHRALKKMDRDDRVRAMYLHACLRYVSRESMTNTSVRERFGIIPRNSATASRLLKEAVESGRVVPYDPRAAPKLMRYLPFWAAPERAGT